MVVTVLSIAALIALFILSPNGRPVLAFFMLLMLTIPVALIWKREISCSWVHISDTGIKLTCFCYPEYEIRWDENPTVCLVELHLGYGVMQKWICISKKTLDPKLASNIAAYEIGNGAIRLQYSAPVYAELTKHISEEKILKYLRRG